jgi:hypothetical protein
MMLQTQDFALFILLYSSFSLFITGLLRSYEDLFPGKLVQIEDMPRLIKRIVVAPGTTDWFFELVANLCCKFGRQWLAERLARSSMDRLYDSFIASADKGW